MTSLKSKIKIPTSVTFSQVTGELVLLNLESGKYYGLDEVGARMYTLLAEHGSLESAYKSMLLEYDVEAEQLESDLIVLVDDLAEQELLEIIDT